MLLKRNAYVGAKERKSKWPGEGIFTVSISDFNPLHYFSPKTVGLYCC